MKKTIILETLVLAAVLAASPAKATPLPLQGAKITATYNGSAAGMLGFDSGYSGGPGSNITGLDPSDISVEFLTSDFLFGFDFAEDGMLTVYNNDTIPFGSYSIVFDFGSSLSQAITSFTLADRNAIGGMPALSLINSHAIGLDLSNVTWRGDYVTFSARISTSAPTSIPEPGSIALVLAGVAGVAASRRQRTRRG